MHVTLAAWIEVRYSARHKGINVELAPIEGNSSTRPIPMSNLSSAFILWSIILKVPTLRFIALLAVLGDLTHHVEIRQVLGRHPTRTKLVGRPQGRLPLQFLPLSRQH